MRCKPYHAARPPCHPQPAHPPAPVLSALVVASCWQSGLMRHLRMMFWCALSLCSGSKCVVSDAPAHMTGTHSKGGRQWAK